MKKWISKKVSKELQKKHDELKKQDPSLETGYEVMLD
jgi:hypothetical protein